MDIALLPYILKNQNAWINDVLKKNAPFYMIPTASAPTNILSTHCKKMSDTEEHIITFGLRAYEILKLIRLSIEESKHMAGNGLAFLWFTGDRMNRLNKLISQLSKVCKKIVTTGKPFHRKERRQMNELLQNEWVNMIEYVADIYVHLDTSAPHKNDEYDLHTFISKTLELKSSIEILTHIEKSIRRKIDYCI